MSGEQLMSFTTQDWKGLSRFQAFLPALAQCDRSTVLAVASDHGHILLTTDKSSDLKSSTGPASASQISSCGTCLLTAAVSKVSNPCPGAC